MNAELQRLKSGALARRHAGDLAGAESMFRHALSLAPDDVDCVHMLGVLCFRTGRTLEAMRFFARAAVLSDWQIGGITRNFGLALCHEYGDSITTKTIAYQAWLNARRRKTKLAAPLVTVVVPSHNHAQFIEACLQSVYRQTWRRIELIVIDDGSTDSSVDRIRSSLRSCPFPQQFVARHNRGAHATINEGISLAGGEYVNILNSDDLFPPARLEKMVTHVAAVGADWGFAEVEVIDENDAAAKAAEGSREELLTSIVTTTESAPTIGFALLRHNVAISTGNLFVRKALFTEIGGFRDLRYVHDHEFALRATLASEPVHVAERLYAYRVHGANTIVESASRAAAETQIMLDGHIQKLFEVEGSSNPFAPTRANWGEYVAMFVLRHACGRLRSGPRAESGDGGDRGRVRRLRELRLHSAKRFHARRAMALSRAPSSVCDIAESHFPFSKSARIRTGCSGDCSRRTGSPTSIAKCPRTCWAPPT